MGPSEHAKHINFFPIWWYAETVYNRQQGACGCYCLIAHPGLLLLFDIKFVHLHASGSEPDAPMHVSDRGTSFVGAPEVWLPGAFSVPPCMPQLRGKSAAALQGEGSSQLRVRARGKQRQAAAKVGKGKCTLLATCALSELCKSGLGLGTVLAQVCVPSQGVLPSAKSLSISLRQPPAIDSPSSGTAQSALKVPNSAARCC